MRILLYASLAILLLLGSRTHAQDAGVTSEPDVGLRAEQNLSAAVVATVKKNEPFTYECETERRVVQSHSPLRGVRLVGAGRDP